MKNGQLRAGTTAGIAGTVSEKYDALGYLQSVYNNPMEPTSVRMRAASVALEFERPRLAVTAVLGSDDFAERLDRAIARSSPKIIEARPITDDEQLLPPAGPEPTPLGAPFARRRC
jgi:hypothetical protein